MKKLLFFSFIVMLGFVMFNIDQAIAKPSEDIISNIENVFYTKASAWTSTFQSYAFKLFYLLMVLEVVMFGVKATLQRTEIADVIAQFITTVLFSAFIYIVILNYAEWSWQIVKGFTNITKSLGFPISASESPFQAGMKVVETIFAKISGWSPVDSLGYLFCGIVVLICFALITAQMLFIKCEAFIAMNASIVLLGFGSCSYFKEYAMNTMRYVLSVAFKLFVMQLVLGLGLSFILELELANAEIYDIFIVIGVSIVLLALVKSLPDVASGIINGSHVSSGAALTSAVSSVAGVMTAGAAATIAAPNKGMDAIKNIKAAASLAGEQGKSGMGKLAGTAGNLWNAHQDSRNDHTAKMSKNLQGKLGEARSGNEAARAESNMSQDGGGV